MVLYGYLDATRADDLKDEGLLRHARGRPAATASTPPGDAEYFVDHVRRSLFELYGSARVYGGGLQRHHDARPRPAAGGGAGRRHASPRPRGATPSGARVDRRAPGEILAMVGGRNWETSKVNLATPGEGCGPPGGVGVQAVHAGRRDAGAATTYDAYWYGPIDDRDPQECPDRTQPDGLWHPVNAEGSGNYTLARRHRALGEHDLRAAGRASSGPRRSSTWRTRSGSGRDLPPVCSITLGIGRRRPARDDERLRDARGARELPLGHPAPAR